MSKQVVPVFSIHNQRNNQIFNGRFKTVKKAGAGAFGEIYKAIDLETNEEVAIKFEPIKTKFPQLYYEAKLYKIFEAPGIPKMYYFGQEGDWNILIMDLLGPNLEDLFEYTRRKFTLKTVLMIGIQMLQRIEYVHSCGFIHRDIKPDNFLIGIGKNQQTIYVIDFGLSKRYKDPRSGKHITYKDGKELTGTARYASLNTHLGIEQARRDDIEQIGYVLMYLIRGSLPWQGLPAKNKDEKYQQIKVKKATTSIEDLTAGYPKEFRHFMAYARKLKFEERPDYEKLIYLLQTSFEREAYQMDYIYDWILRRQALKQRMIQINESEEKLMIQESAQKPAKTPAPAFNYQARNDSATRMLQSDQKAQPPSQRFPTANQNQMKPPLESRQNALQIAAAQNIMMSNQNHQNQGIRTDHQYQYPQGQSNAHYFAQGVYPPSNQDQALHEERRRNPVRSQSQTSAHNNQQQSSRPPRNAIPGVVPHAEPNTAQKVVRNSPYNQFS